MFAKLNRTASRALVPWEPSDSVRAKGVSPFLAVSAAAITAYAAFPFFKSLPDISRAIFATKPAISEPLVPVQPKPLVVPPGPFKIDVPPGDTVVIAAPRDVPVVVNGPEKVITVGKAVSVTPPKLVALSPPKKHRRHGQRVRPHKVIVEASDDAMQGAADFPSIDLEPLPPRPIPTPGLFPLPLKIFLADVFGGPRP